MVEPEELFSSALGLPEQRIPAYFLLWAFQPNNHAGSVKNGLVAKAAGAPYSCRISMSGSVPENISVNPDSAHSRGRRDCAGLANVLQTDDPSFLRVRTRGGLPHCSKL